MKCVCVDDEAVFRDWIVKLASQFARNTGIEMIMQSYASPNLLLYDLGEQVHYDLYLLDIEFPDGMNGLELAAEIRKKDENAFIVFLTSHEEFALDGYECHAFQYVLKDQMENLLKVFGQIARRLDSNEEKFLLVANHSKIEIVWYREIIYIFKNGKNSIYFCQKGRCCTERKSLAKIREELKAPQMLAVGKSYIINMNHVRTIDGYDIFFDEDLTPIRVSRYQINEVKKSLLNYLKGKMK